MDGGLLRTCFSAIAVFALLLSVSPGLPATAAPPRAQRLMLAEFTLLLEFSCSSIKHAFTRSIKARVPGLQCPSEWRKAQKE